MKKVLFVLSFLSFSSAFSQNHYSFLLHKSYSQRFQLLDSMFYEPDPKSDSITFFKAADEIERLAKKERDEDLYFDAEFIKWRYYPYSDIRKDYTYLVPKLTELLQQAEQKNIRQLQIRILDNLGLYYYKEVKYAPAIEQYLRAYYLLKNISLKEFPNKRDYVYDNLSLIYFYLNDYSSVKKYLLELDSLPVFTIPYFRKMRAVINTTNTLGEVYRNLSRFDSAEYFFKKAYYIAEKAQDTVWMGIAGGNIGSIYFLQKRYAEAIPLLERDIHLSIATGDTSNAANDLAKLAKISMAGNDNAKAWQQVWQARTVVDKKYYKLLGELYSLIAELYAGQGNMKLAYQYKDSALIAKDSVFNQNNAVELTRVELKTAIGHHLAEVQQLENQKKIRTLQRNSLICLIILMTAITVLLINRQRLLKKQKQFAEAQKQQAITELISAKQQLNTFTTNIREKNELIERLTNEMNELHAVLGKDALDYREQTLAQLRKSTILTEQEWETFRSTFEIAYPAYFINLQEKLPGLSAAELRFMALSKLKFNAKEMAAILGISPSSIRMSRHRLRKKFNIANEEALETLVESI